LFRYCQCIVYFNAQISDRAFNLGMSEQKLDGAEISRPAIDQGSVGDLPTLGCGLSMAVFCCRGCQTGLIPPPASPHIIYDPMEIDTRAAKDQG
jgi:hypothetical protein